MDGTLISVREGSLTIVNNCHKLAIIMCICMRAYFFRRAAQLRTANATLIKSDSNTTDIIIKRRFQSIGPSIHIDWATIFGLVNYCMV